MKDIPLAVQVPRTGKGEPEHVRRVRLVACNIAESLYFDYGWQLIGASIMDASNDDIDNIQVFAILVVAVPDCSDTNLPDGTMAAGRDLIKFYSQLVQEDLERRYGSEFADSVALDVRGEVRRGVIWVPYT